MSLEFSGAQSLDRDGNVTKYSWNFGDGTSSLGIQASHTYKSLGLFTTTLTVTDDDGASSSASVLIQSRAQSAGYYTGSIFSDVTESSTKVEVIIGANHIIHAHDWFNFRTSYWGDLTATDDGASGVLSAEVWNPAFVFPDGSTVGVVNVEAEILARRNIFGTYSGAADSGTVDIHYLPELAERPSSLSEVSGAWGWTDGAAYAATLMVSVSGKLDYSDTDGCTGRGHLVVLEPSLNGYQFQIEWSCPDSLDPAWNGAGTGLAFVDDYHVPGTHWLVFAESVWNGTSNVWSMERPASLASGSLSSETNRSETVSGPQRGSRRRR